VGNDSGGEVHGTEQVDLELTAHLGIGEGLAETKFGIAGIVDQHVDRTEPLDGLDGHRVCGFSVGDIEREGVQAIVFAPKGSAHRVSGPRRCHHSRARIAKRRPVVKEGTLATP
jgi:hypothetical protein